MSISQTARTCLHCGRPFTSRYRAARYCSRSCAAKHTYKNPHELRRTRRMPYIPKTARESFAYWASTCADERDRQFAAECLRAVSS